VTGPVVSGARQQQAPHIGADVTIVVEKLQPRGATTHGAPPLFETGNGEPRIRAKDRRDKYECIGERADRETRR